MFVNILELGKVTLKGEHSNLLQGFSRPWPLTFWPYTSDPVIPFNSSPVTQSGWNETLCCGNELLHTHSGECSSLCLHPVPTRSLIISIYQSPILQSPSQIPTPRTMTWIRFPREKLLPSLNSHSTLKTPNIYSKLSVFFFSLSSSMLQALWLKK